jgi:hypothetical protein
MLLLDTYLFILININKQKRLEKVSKKFAKCVFQLMASNSLPASPSAPSVTSQPSQTPNAEPAEPLSTLNAQAIAAVENVVQNLLMDSLGGSSGKRYFSPLFFTLCTCY